jgi:hypothetical protein
MSLRSTFAFVLLVSLAPAAFVACGSSDKACGLNCDDGDSGSGGSTSAGNGSGDTSTSASGTTSSTGGGCFGCADYLADPSLDAAAACTDDGPPSSTVLLASLSNCACEGTCVDVCGDSYCAGSAPSPSCNECLTGCEAYPACANAGGGSTSSSSSTGGGPCITCFALISGNGSALQLCTDDGPPSSSEVFFTLIDCVCEGPCTDVCITSSLCDVNGTSIDNACTSCLLSDTGCGAIAQQCKDTAAGSP